MTYVRRSGKSCIDGDSLTLTESTPGAYSINKTGLTVRDAPYTVFAKVRQGGTTIVTEERQFYIDDTAGVTLAAPENGATVKLNQATPLTATLTATLPTGHTLKFFVDGAAFGTATAIGGKWSVNWTPTVQKTYTVLAKVVDGVGAVVTQTKETMVTATIGGPDAAPKAINITLPHLNNPDAGTLPGELGVSASGAATYSIPIVVPPGTAGLQPNLSLSYSSSAQNDRLGVGWSLGGSSSIHRCGKTIAQDDVNDRIGFTNGDRLCLDGQRLVLVNKTLTDDNYWSAGAEFRTEIDSFSRISAEGPIEARTFKVESKDGRIMLYGYDSSKVIAYAGYADGKKLDKLVARSAAQSWALQKVSDRSGNWMQYHYSQSDGTGEHWLHTIRYGGNGQKPHAAVYIAYADRVDSWTRYLDETRRDLRLRISQIKTYVGDNLEGQLLDANIVRQYAFSYELSQSSGRSLLKNVEACARNPGTGAMECLPKTIFEWGQPDTSKAPGFVSVGTWANAPKLTVNNKIGSNKYSSLHADYFAFSDFDNDGIGDVLEKRVASPTPPTLTAESYVSRGNPIAPGTLRSQYTYYRNTGKAATGFDTYTYRLSTGENFAVLDVGDFNGDGALDLLVWTENNNVKRSRICTSPLSQPGALGAPKSTITFDCNNSYSSTGENHEQRLPFVVDVIGDGRSAHYGPVNSGRAPLCIGTAACFEDLSPPRALNRSHVDPRELRDPLRDYVAFTQMVDFAGIGRPYDVRWTNPYFVYRSADVDSTILEDKWYNAQPVVAVTGFRKPGTPLAEMRDIVYPEYFPCTGENNSCFPYFFDQLYQGGALSADFNGSGYTSLVFGFIEMNPGPGPKYQRAETTICLSTGRGFDCGVRSKYSGRPANGGDTAYSVIHAVGNFVGDGAPSILVEKLSYATNNPQRNGQLQMCRLSGDATANDKSDANMVCRDWSGPALPDVGPGDYAHDAVYFMDLLGTGRTQLVKYHSGKYVGDTWDNTDRWEVFAPVDQARDK